MTAQRQNVEWADLSRFAIGRTWIDNPTRRIDVNFRSVGVQVGLAGVAFIALLALALGGCGPLVNTDSDVQRSGKLVSDSTFSQIKSGQTTTDWLTENLGEPSERCKLDDGVEVWKWCYTERKQSHGEVFIIFRGADTKETTHVMNVQVKDGLVTRKWRG
jgi:outer membrane protein assembly factor BamE (lipoprotein component of BamABCDE complex)